MCPVVSRFDAKRRRMLESRSPFGRHPVLRKAAVGGGEQAASRDRHAPSGMENAYRGACSLAVSRQANPLDDGLRLGGRIPCATCGSGRSLTGLRGSGQYPPHASCARIAGESRSGQMRISFRGGMDLMIRVVRRASTDSPPRFRRTSRSPVSWRKLVKASKRQGALSWTWR